ncbi:GDP-L-fucose synthase family protein [Rhodanobacter ginsengiterrae]|uniref:GDP-L-fucose synthase family protein n=1 Tax=Rhodanobacter ginsengiterrae TaxID=2008451 RepID=UPI003CF91A94
MNLDSRIYIAGHRGLVGSALVRRLTADGATNLISRSHSELDLTNQAAVETFFASERPEYVFLVAAKVGGIHANSTYPAEFIHDNLAIQTNVIHNAWKHGTKKLLFLGSSCIYPRDCPQPIKEEYLLTGPLEPTNEWYAIAKIAGLKMCQAYRQQYGFDAICAMPTNLYGPGDNFDLDNSHVIPALIRRFHEAKMRGDKEVAVWGTGRPLRELLHVDDLADALLLLAQNYDGNELVNVGSGLEHSIADIARVVANTVGFEGHLYFDLGKPDGAPRKLLDSAVIRSLGWHSFRSLSSGLASTYADFLERANER